MGSHRDALFGLVPILVVLAHGCGTPDGADGADAGDPADAANPADAAGSHIFDEAAANPGVWTWIPIEGAYCRDGSPAGLGLRTHVDGPGLVIFMHGGGGCFNADTCDMNRPAFGGDDFTAWVEQMGDKHIFNPDNGMNPVRDWHAAFISYCTGDFHGGTRSGVDVPGGPTDQSFVGHDNMVLMTTLLSDYFRDVEHVLLVGSSAGGFGTTLNYVHVAEAFAPTRVTLLDDSGPFLPNNEAFRPCLQRLMRDLWGLDAVLPADCASCFSASGDGLSNLFAHLGATYPEARFGLLSTTGDLVARTGFGYGRNNCDPNVTLPVPVDDYTTGLFELRDGLPGNWATAGLCTPSWLRFQRCRSTA